MIYHQDRCHPYITDNAYNHNFLAANEIADHMNIILEKAATICRTEKEKRLFIEREFYLIVPRRKKNWVLRFNNKLEDEQSGYYAIVYDKTDDTMQPIIYFRRIAYDISLMCEFEKFTKMLGYTKHLDGMWHLNDYDKGKLTQDLVSDWLAYRQF